MTLDVLDPGSRTTILVHYYRAMVGRADVWRMRMDTTANWAIGATAAVVSFVLGNSEAPHYVVFIASLLTLSFLLLEARRLTFYHLWQQRVLLLERGMVWPALSGHGDAAGSEPEVDLVAALDEHLGRTVPTMPIGIAAARRLRRVYLYLFGVQLLAWLLKLANHPTPFASPAQLIDRADIGLLPGGVVVAAAICVSIITVGIAAFKGGIDRDPA